MGGQGIKTFPVEDSDCVPSNRIYRPEDNCLHTHGGENDRVCLPKPSAPGLFSSLDHGHDSDDDNDGAGKGMGFQRREAPSAGGDGGSEAQAAGWASCGPQPTQAGQDGLEWVPEEELVKARQLPLVRWAEACGRTDKRALAEIGRFIQLPFSSTHL
jgi:hypothetical protein